MFISKIVQNLVHQLSLFVLYHIKQPYEGSVWNVKMATLWEQLTLIINLS